MADDSVVLEFLAQVDAARAELERFVSDSDAALARLAKEGRTEIVVDVAQARVNLDRLAAQLREFLAQADRVRVTSLRLDASQPLQQVTELEARVRAALQEIEAVGAASGPSLTPVEVAFRAASAAVDDFAARSQADSETFGRGFQSAALEARLALERLEAALLALREEGGGVTQADLERLLALREGYAQAVVGAGEFVETQQAVKRELAGEASALETAQLRLASYLALLEAAGGALTPLQAATRVLEGTLLDLGSRLSATSATFGQGLPAAAQKAVAALAQVRAEMAAAAEQPGGVSEAQLARIRELEAAYQRLIVRLREFEVETGAGDAAARGAQPAVQGLGDKFRELAGYINLYLATKIATELTKLGGAALEAELGMERINAAFRQARGSAEAAREEFEFVKKAAELLGLPLRETANEYARFQAAATLANVPLQSQRDILLGLGAANAVFHLSAEQSANAMLVMREIASRATVDLTHLQRQLSNDIPGAMEVAAKAFGYTGPEGLNEFTQAVKKGEVASADFLRLFGPELVRSFGDALPAAIGSTTNEINRLHNSEFELSASLAEQFTPTLRHAIDAVREFGKENANAFAGVGTLGSASLKGVEILASASVGAIRLVEATAYGVLSAISSLQANIAEGISKLSGGRLFGEVAIQLRATTEALREESKTAFDEALKLRQGVVDAFTGAARASGDLRGSVTALVASFGEAPPKFDLAAQALRRSVEAIREYDREIRDAPEPTREAADKIVGEIDKALKAIAQLPTVERQAQQDVVRELSVLREHYESFTTAYLKLHDQQAKAAETAARRELAVLRQRDDAWQKLLGLIQSVSNAEDKEASKKLAAAEEDLASKKSRLSALDSQNTLTPDELNEQEELRKSIGETEAAVKSLQRAQVEQGRAGVEAATANEQAAERLDAQFRKAIATDDVLRDSIARLGPAGRDALGGLLQDLVELQRRGGGTKQEVDDITARIVRLAEEGGVASAHLAERLGLVTDTTKSLRGAMASLTPEASKASGSLHEVGEGGQAAGAGLDRATASAGHSKEALAEQAAQAHASAAATHTLGTVHAEAAAAIDKGSSAVKGASTVAHLAAIEARGLGTAVEGAAKAAKPGFEEIGKGFRELSTDANKALASVDFKPMENGLRELSTDAAVAVSAVEREARALDAATRAGGVFDLETGKLKNSFAELQKASDSSVAGLVSWGGHLQALPTKDAADKQRELAASFAATNAAAVAAAGPVEAVAQRLDAAATSASSAANVIELTKDKVNLLGTGAGEAAGHLTTVKEQSDAAAPSVQTVGDKSGDAAPKIELLAGHTKTVGERSSEAAPQIALVAGHTKSLAVSADEAKRPMAEFGTAVHDTARALVESDLPSNLDAIERSGRRLSPIASLLAQSFDKIARAKLGDELEKIADEGDGAAEGLDAVKTALADLATADLDKASKGVDAVAKAFHSLGDEMKLAYDSAGKVAGRMESIIILAGRLADRIAALGAAATSHI